MQKPELQRMNPLSDVVFNKLFEDISSAPALLEIINAVLIDAGDEPVSKIVEIKSQYGIIAADLGMHGARLDVQAIAANGDLFDIEVQLRKQKNMNAREFFYAGMLQDDNFKAAASYKDLPNVRVICLMDFVLREEHEAFLQPIGILYRKSPHDEATDCYRAYNIELPKFEKLCPTLEAAQGKPLWQWLYLLYTGYRNEAELEVLETMSEGLHSFTKKYRMTMDDPKVRNLYRLELSALRNRVSEMSEAREEGIEIGELRAKVKANYAMIRSMIRDGAPLELIYRYVPATPAEIDEMIIRLKAEA